MVANILTKALLREKHEYCMKLMGVVDLEFEMEDNNTQLLVPPASSIATNKENNLGLHRSILRRKT
jgi:hypothetical protein